MILQAILSCECTLLVVTHALGYGIILPLVHFVLLEKVIL